MSIVFMECSIEMYYTKRSGGRSSEERHTQKRVGGFVSLQKIIICHFAAARPAWHLVRRIQTRAKCDLTEWRLPAEFRPGPQTDCRTAAAQLSTQSELPRPCLRLNRLDGSRSASTARLCQVGSTSPAWVESDTHWQASPCHFRLRVKPAATEPDSEFQVRRRVGRERPATLRTDSDVTGSACQCIVPFSSAQTPLQLHLQEYG